MTRDDIMALANQAAGQHWMDEAHIQRFAALVAAAEREACAKVCDELVTHTQARGHGDATLAAFSCAATIRARSNP
jgi:hypothetical protein